jgi:hypothetical protein
MSSDFDRFVATMHTPEEIAEKIYLPAYEKEFGRGMVRRVEGTIEIKVGKEWEKVEDIHNIFSEAAGAGEYIGFGVMGQYGKTVPFPEKGGSVLAMLGREQFGRKVISGAEQFGRGITDIKRMKDVYSGFEYAKLYEQKLQSPRISTLRSWERTEAVERLEERSIYRSLSSIEQKLPREYKIEAYKAFSKGKQLDVAFKPPFVSSLAPKSPGRMGYPMVTKAFVDIMPKKTSKSISISKSVSAMPSFSFSKSISPTSVSLMSLSASQSKSASISPPSMSPSKSPSISPSMSLSVSPSVSPSISPSISPSVSPSVSPSISRSFSLSPSPSISGGSGSIREPPPPPPPPFPGFGLGGKRKKMKFAEEGRMKNAMRDIGLNLISAMKVQAKGKLQVTQPTVSKMTERRARKYELWGAPAQEELDAFKNAFRRRK